MKMEIQDSRTRNKKVSGSWFELILRAHGLLTFLLNKKIAIKQKLIRLKNSR